MNIYPLLVTMRRTLSLYLRNSTKPTRCQTAKLRSGGQVKNDNLGKYLHMRTFVNQL